MTLRRVLLGLSIPLSAGVLDAQIIRGVVKSQRDERVLEGVRVTAINRLAKPLAEVVSDAEGKFFLRVDAGGQPFVVQIRRIGLMPSASDEIRAKATDTLDFDFLVPESPVANEAIRVIGEKSNNERHLEEANRRGWRVIPPELVADWRDRAQTMSDLLRATAGAGLTMPRRDGDCIRSSRSGNRCLTWVVDGVVLGPSAILNPRDVYFMAVLSPSEAAVQWGDRAPSGAIVVWTRAYGDRVKR
ncbi:MAG: carboxypeptidase-like regulatory domain-containing protein [Gemmatimonadaceae bacterium]|nr:carboxypeptidase-like regulatory domain-containing protein [Gemmatimonadaceae bacterium]